MYKHVETSMLVIEQHVLNLGCVELATEFENVDLSSMSLRASDVLSTDRVPGTSMGCSSKPPCWSWRCDQPGRARQGKGIRLVTLNAIPVSYWGHGYTKMYQCAYTHMYTYIYTVHMYVYTCASVLVYTHTHMCVYTYITTNGNTTQGHRRR